MLVDARELVGSVVKLVEVLCSSVACAHRSVIRAV